ncbi:alpha-ketoglutarate decarboxylase [Maribacter hydrothermalis]|uniref:Alpha-ketoglutarate decarboxylase n=1 Tax=Maribacter hydrothermalis TaxID=1836467 RepID=A0A1B7ZFS5_9FLAO|nr:alpha-ketoglutarate decarboxylase [Maribacter hydrothermalis]APQ19321.1 alpha-ketoglutarate decarboxylase [Maribacter hydrothermalis]OBR42417.1 alpha-ketoglutarate decarboxylase [Maribacter hydrothermalis]
MSLKKTIYTVLFSLNLFFSFAQNSSNAANFWNNVRFGGGLGLGFTNNGFNGSISPSAIYEFNEQFAAGTGLSFNYAKFNDDKFLAYGGSILSLFNPIPQLQISAEFEQLRINRTIATQTIDVADNYWLPAFFIGAGYSTRNVTMGLRYDLLFDDSKSIYGNALMPFVRVYF